MLCIITTGPKLFFYVVAINTQALVVACDESFFVPSS
jgi:hypothetical protein